MYVCTCEEIGLSNNFHSWLRQPLVEITKSPICSRVQLILIVSRTDRFPIQIVLYSDQFLLLTVNPVLKVLLTTEI